MMGGRRVMNAALRLHHSSFNIPRELETESKLGGITIAEICMNWPTSNYSRTGAKRVG